MAKPNFQFKKRQKELAKKAKKEQKRQKKLAQKAEETDIQTDPVLEDTTPPETTE